MDADLPAATFAGAMLLIGAPERDAESFAAFLATGFAADDGSGKAAFCFLAADGRVAAGTLATGFALLCFGIGTDAFCFDGEMDAFGFDGETGVRGVALPATDLRAVGLTRETVAFFAA